MSHLNVRFREAVFGQYCAKPPVRPNACKRYGVTGGKETIVTVGTVEKNQSGDTHPVLRDAPRIRRRPHYFNDEFG